MFLEYLFILKFVIFCTCISLILCAVSFLLVYQKGDLEKLSSYECGFNPYGDARSKFEVKFYLIGILFIIFDLEITFLFPWVVSIFTLSYSGIYVMFVFLFILTIGFYMNDQKVL